MRMSEMIESDYAYGVAQWARELAQRHHAPGDEQAAAVAIVVKALELLTPGMSAATRAVLVGGE